MKSDLDLDQASANVTLTIKAAARIRTVLQDEPHGSMLRVGVDGGGCSGFQYVFKIDMERNEDDIVIEKEGAKVIVDTVSLAYMSGSTIDFVDDLMGQSFKIENPHAKASCGCGVSFTV